MRRGILIGTAAAAVAAFTMTGALAQTPMTTPHTGSSHPNVKDSSKAGGQPPAGSTETKGNHTEQTTGMSPNGMSNGTMPNDGTSTGRMNRNGMGR